VLSPAPPPVGTAISLEVTLPAVELDTPGLQLRFEGVVVRSEESVEGGGLAISGDFQPHVAGSDLRDEDRDASEVTRYGSH
jgi:hypothetical protein